MFKKFVEILVKIIDRRVIVLFLVLAFLILFFPWRFFPDFFHLGRLSGKKEAIFRLLTTIIGYSGLMLTLLLVGYNFYVKTTRRFTLDFVTDNRFLKLIVSLFFGMVLFVGLGFCFIETNSAINNITILYFSYFFTIGFLLSLFPLALLAISESNSLHKVYKILDGVSEEDLNKLYQTNFQLEQSIEALERNPILVVRDLCVAAVADKDWILPQSVLEKLFFRFILSLNNQSSPFEVQRAVFIWSLFADRLKGDVVKHSDVATGNTLFFQAIRAHEHFAAQKVMHIRGNKFDDFIISYLRLIIESNAFYSFQGYISRHLTDVIKTHFQAFRYSDEQAPTLDYRISTRKHADDNSYRMTNITNYWFYLTHELPNVLTETIEYSIDLRRKDVYSPAFWNIQSIMDEIYDDEDLTFSQKRDALKEYLYKSRRLSDYAIAHKVFDGVEPTTHIQIEKWLEKDSYIGWDAFYSFKEMIRKLSGEKAELSLYLDHFFLVGRSLSHKPIDESLLNEVVEYILQFALDLFKKYQENLPLRQQILYQTNWFYRDYLNKDERLTVAKEKLDDRVVALLTQHSDQIPKY